jgi:acyl-CoA thioesterase-1
VGAPAAGPLVPRGGRTLTDGQVSDPRLLDAFWLSSSMIGESLMFVDPGDGVATAALLFRGAERLELISATGETTFEAGRDYTVDAAAGIISRTRESRIPFATLAELYPTGDPFVLITDGDEFHRRQVAASYRHGTDGWSGRVPVLAAPALSRTMRRLRASQPLTIGVAGDSISEGYNASGFTGAPPYQPPYPNLVAEGLERASGSRVILHNFATAGWTSDDGAADVERLAAVRPDLALIAFGMNDAGYADAPAFAANILSIMNGIRASSPDVQFVLVSPMLPNPRWTYPAPERFPAYRDALAGLCGDGVALADVTSLWSDLLARKSVHDLTGNGINHPNDFGHRIYAQVILALLGYQAVGL